MTSAPISYRVAPEAPELRNTRRDLKPMVAKEEEVVRALQQPAKVIRSDLPAENAAERLEWKSRKSSGCV